MAEGPVHKKLKDFGMIWLRDKVIDLTSREVKYKNMRSIADVVGMNYKRKEIRIIECKASREDYFRDNKLMDLDESYYKHCNYFYIMCPEGILNLDDVPKEYGLLWLNSNDEVIVKRSPKKYDGKLKTQFNTTLKRCSRSLTNSMVYKVIIPKYEKE